MSQTPTRPQISSLRVQAAQNPVNIPAECPDCGSIFFAEKTVAMFTPGGTGFRNVSMSPMKVYECVCGKLILPQGFNTGVPAGSERDLFVQSVRLAVAKRDSLSLDKIAQGVPSLAEHKDLVSIVTSLIERFDSMLSGSDVETEDASPEAEVSPEPFVEPEPVQEPAPVKEIPLVASGFHGRSAAAAEGQQQGEARIVDAGVRAVHQGGARSRLKRQGGQ